MSGGTAPAPKSTARRVLALGGRALVLELTMYANLVRWVARRPAVAHDQEAIPYAQAVTPVMSLWIFASAVEMPLVHVLLPWRSAQVVALALGVWTLVWMFGALAGLRVYPHLMTAEGLTLRNGATVAVTVPWESIAGVTTREVELPTTLRSLQPQETDAGTDLRVGVSGRVNLHVELHEPLPVSTGKGDLTVRRVGCWVDEPRLVAARIRDRARNRAGA